MADLLVLSLSRQIQSSARISSVKWEGVRLSRNDAVDSGEHTRPRVCQSAPSPTGSAAFEVTQRCCESRARNVVGGAPTTAPEGACAPQFNRIVGYEPVQIGRRLHSRRGHK